MSTSIPPLLILSDNAFPLFAAFEESSTCVVISNGTGLNKGTRS
jgi:hypothetical protein